MRLREYLEIRDGLKSKLRESNSNGQVDVVDLMRDAYNNKKPASFINDILAAGYDTGDEYGYGAGEAHLVRFDDLDDYLKANMRYCKDIKDFPSYTWDTIVDQIESLGEFKRIQDMEGQAGSHYDFYFAALPADDLNFEDYAKEVIAVDKGQNVLYVGHKAYDKFIEALDYMVTSNNITTVEDATDFFIATYLNSNNSMSMMSIFTDNDEEDIDWDSLKITEDYDDEYQDDEDILDDFPSFEDAINFNLENYGFTRNENEDDSYYYSIAYSVKDADRVVVHVSYSKDENAYDVYASISGNLSAMEKYKLPHMSAVMNPRVSGLSADQMTPQDWKAFHDDCVAYQKEYEAAELGSKSSNGGAKEPIITEDIDFEKSEVTFSELVKQFGQNKVIEILDKSKLLSRILKILKQDLLDESAQKMVKELKNDTLKGNSLLKLIDTFGVDGLTINDYKKWFATKYHCKSMPNKYSFQSGEQDYFVYIGYDDINKAIKKYIEEAF